MSGGNVSLSIGGGTIRDATAFPLSFVPTATPQGGPAQLATFHNSYPSSRVRGRSVILERCNGGSSNLPWLAVLGGCNGGSSYLPWSGNRSSPLLPPACWDLLLGARCLSSEVVLPPTASGFSVESTAILETEEG